MHEEVIFEKTRLIYLMYDDAIYEKYKETQSIPRDAFLFIHKFFNNGLCMPKALLDDLC